MIAAVENGADAVYLGGKLFNARINAGNFNDEELKAAVDFAHKRGVKVYVTMNTLMKDEELQPALEYAAFLYRAGADALIIQDLGLGSLIGRSMPDFPLHLSTQGSVYDLRGAEAAYELGYERVVLARELSFEEISHICANTSAEIEVFVHGALCICYSGQCQMSRYFGGRSGNRGQCAQPCRLPYKTLDEKGRLLETFKYPLSPKDLCTVDHLGDLVEAGVESLKIEGRMKSPEYVAVVTSIYRKYLDLYYEKGGYTVSPEDRSALEQIFNRGGFTEGYFDGNPGPELMSGSIPKHRGVPVGEVVKKVQGTSLIDIRLYGPLTLGDGVEIQSREITGNVVTYYKELKGGLTRIGDIKGKVQRGDRVFRITSREQLKQAQQTFSHKSYDEGKFLRKTPVDMVFGCSAEGLLSLELKSPLASEAVKVTAGPYDFGEGAADVQRVRKALGKTGNTPFFARRIEVTGLSDKNIQVSSINDIRRQGLKSLEEALTRCREDGEIRTDLQQAEAEGAGSPGREDAETAARLEIYFYDWDSFAAYHTPWWMEELPAEIVFLLPAAEAAARRDELDPARKVIPYVTSISKGEEDRRIEASFDILCEMCAETGIYAGNLGWLKAFSEAGVPVWGDYGLNVYNRRTWQVYRNLGARDCVMSLEAMGDGFGSFPLMISEHSPEGAELVDRKKEKIRLVKRDFSDQVLLAARSAPVDPERIKAAFAAGEKIVRIYT